MGVSVKIIALVALVPAVAEAGHCHEVSHVVGYERCSRFGAWSRPPSIWIEGGMVALRIDPGRIDADASSASGLVHLSSAPGDTRGINASGGTFRDLIGFRGGYFGSETDVATFSDGPQLVVDASPRGGVAMASSSGTIFQAKVLIGYRQLYGPLSLALEAAGGFRGVTFDAMGAQGPFEMSGLVEAHARADVWVSEHWTVGAEVATDVLRMHDDAIALTLGVHLTPWDGLR
jgi:hypothetical protein